MNKNIYDEEPNNELNTLQTPVAQFIEFDFSKSQTLLEMINQVKGVMSTEPSNPQIYIVCGRQVAENDYNELFDFIYHTYSDFFNERIYIRGFIHPEFIRLLLLYKCILLPNTKIVYDNKKNYMFWENLKLNVQVQTRFIQRLNSGYVGVQSAYFDLSELDNLGINYEKN